MNSPQQQSLPRVLGPWMASAIVVGTVIGTGVFKKGRNVAENVPEFGLAVSVWVLGGVLALLGALTLAETAIRYPKAGGNYVFLREGYGRWAGFLWGWVEFGIIRTASIAVLATMCIECLFDALKQSSIITSTTGSDDNTFWARQFLTAAVIIALAFINALGTKIGGRIQVLLTGLKVGSILGIILLPIAILLLVANPEYPPSLANLQPPGGKPYWPEDWSKIDWVKYGSAVVAVLWAYHGWMNIGPVAEEVKNPSRNIPLSLLGGVVLLIGLYVGANVAYYTVVPQPEMAKLSNTTVATVFCIKLLRSIGGVIASLIVMTSAFGSLNGNILIAPRLLYAMGEDRLAPQSLRELHPTFQTPARAMAVFAGWSVLLVLAAGVLTVNRIPTLELFGRTIDLNVPKGKVPFDILTDYCIFGAVIFETMAVAAIFRFRWTQPEVTAQLPYRCLGYPVVPSLYILIMLSVLASMFLSEEHNAECKFGLVYIGVGAMLYAILFGWRK